MGAVAARYMNDGMLVPDEVVSAIIIDALKRAELASKSWVLVGAPRSPGQAQTLLAEGIRPDLLVWIDRDDEQVVAELVLRGHPPIVADTMLKAGRRNKKKVLACFPGLVHELDGSAANEKLVEDIHRTASKGLEQSLVILVGGPRAGKNVVCARLARDLSNKYSLLSMEAIIRKAAKTNNQLATYLMTGNPVPTGVLVELIKSEMDASPSKSFVMGDLLGFGRYSAVVADMAEMYVREERWGWRWWWWLVVVL